MGKRFTDTDLWDKEWFMDLAPAEKCAWYYIKDRCDNVGVWSPNRKLANVVIGADVDWEALPGKCHGNIRVLPSGKWLIVDFVRFQHPDIFKAIIACSNNGNTYNADDSRKVPCYVMWGALESTHPGERTANELIGRGWDVTTRQHSSGHTVPQTEIPAMGDWLNSKIP